MPSTPTKFFTHNGPNVEALWASKNVSNGFLQTATDQSNGPVLIPDLTLHGLNNSDPTALVVDHTSDAVSHNKGKPPLLSTDDFVQPDDKLENKKSEAPVLFRGVTPLLNPVNILVWKMLLVSPSTYSDNPHTKSITTRSLARVSILGSLSLFSGFALRAGVQKSGSSISFGKSGNEPILVAHGRLGYLSLSLSRQISLWPLEMNSDPPPQHQLGWWCIHAPLDSSSLEDYIGCKASTGTDDDGINGAWWRVRSARKQGGKTRFVAAVCQNNCGGVSPNVPGVSYFDSGLHGDCNLSTCCGRNTLCYGRGPGHPGDFEGTQIIGGSTEVVKTCPTARGFGIAAGATDGPGAFDLIQGDDRANPFWKLVHDGMNTPGKKQMLAANGMPMCRLHCPVQLLVEHTRKVQFSLGQLAVLNVPTNFTTLAGSHPQEAKSKALGQPGTGSEGSPRAARQRVTLRLLTSWFDIPWVKMEAIKAMIVPTLGTLILVIGANGFTAAASVAGNVASSVTIAALFGAAEAEPFEFQTDIERVIEGIDRAVVAVKTREVARTAVKLNHQGLDSGNPVEERTLFPALLPKKDSVSSMFSQRIPSRCHSRTSSNDKKQREREKSSTLSLP
ncbi:hypothetical protein Nepgr_018305 [Nepenthes gracilis]|uniref:Neutral ceramidase n=1 Tax=Nepenthes gracilis TaxID=150966 RepID=A0AAD3ST65_NEPGR|nr:hypothetical protein Nepgr_018305 [Nepenthes gracilis]